MALKRLRRAEGKFFGRAEILAIRDRAKSVTYAQVAREWRISPTLVSGIVTGLYYGEVPEGIIPPGIRPKRARSTEVEIKAPQGMSDVDRRIVDEVSAAFTGESAIKAGDVVKLRSGGPSMVVGEVSPLDIAQVTYWDGKALLHDRLPVAMLTRAS